MENPQSSGRKNTSKKGTVMPNNTTDEQDSILSGAKNIIESAFNDAIEVIEQLDSEITQWKIASGCETPKELKRKLQKMEGK